MSAKGDLQELLEAALQHLYHVDKKMTGTISRAQMTLLHCATLMIEEVESEIRGELDKEEV